MVNRFVTDKFDVAIKGSDMLTISKCGMGNSLFISSKDIDDLIAVLNKAKVEFNWK